MAPDSPEKGCWRDRRIRETTRLSVTMTRFLRPALAALVLASLSAPAIAQKKKPVDRSGMAVQEKLRVAKAVSALLLDGKAAKFSFLPFITRKGASQRTYCGLVNARNAIGRYTGLQPFLAYVTLARGQVALVQVYGIATRDQLNPVTVEVRRRCAEAGYKLPPPR